MCKVRRTATNCGQSLANTLHVLLVLPLPNLKISEIVGRSDLKGLLRKRVKCCLREGRFEAFGD